MLEYGTVTDMAQTEQRKSHSENFLLRLSLVLLTIQKLKLLSWIYKLATKNNSITHRNKF